MKKSYKSLSRNIFFIVFLFPFVSNAISYTSINNGDWNDRANWSTNGGITACNCTPGNISNGNNIYIKHHINLTDNITVNGASELIVLYSSSLSSPVKSITATHNSYLLFLGPIQLNKLINGKSNGTAGSIIDIHHILEINGQIDIYAGDVNLIGGYLNMLAGNFLVAEEGNFNTSNGAKLELFVGNITNFGDIFICADCCIETRGNWTNELTGTVLGSGSALTNIGNMKNFNTPASFSSEINWCSAGNDFGMPSTEDCSVATQTCGIVQLPTEISNFEGKNIGEYNEIFWTTDSENNCDYFSLQKSYDGVNWIELDQHSGAGNSQERQFYYSKDKNLRQITYYRLEQVDLNGELKMSNPISVVRNDNDAINIYPNPAIASDVLSISGAEKGSAVLIRNNKGQTILNLIVDENKLDRFELSTAELIKGVYFVEVINRTKVDYLKLVIQ